MLDTTTLSKLFVECKNVCDGFHGPKLAHELMFNNNPTKPFGIKAQDSGNNSASFSIGLWAEFHTRPTLSSTDNIYIRYTHPQVHQVVPIYPCSAVLLLKKKTTCNNSNSRFEVRGKRRYDPNQRWPPSMCRHGEREMSALEHHSSTGVCLEEVCSSTRVLKHTFIHIEWYMVIR